MTKQRILDEFDYVLNHGFFSHEDHIRLLKFIDELQDSPTAIEDKGSEQIGKKEPIESKANAEIKPQPNIPKLPEDDLPF